MAIAIGTAPVSSQMSARPLYTRLFDNMRYWIGRLFYAVLGAAGVLLWLLMQLPLGTRVKGTMLAVMAGCFGMFMLGWRLLGEQASGLRRR